MKTKPIHYHYLYIPHGKDEPAIPLIPCSMLSPTHIQLVSSYPHLVDCPGCKEWLHKWGICENYINTSLLSNAP